MGSEEYYVDSHFLFSTFTSVRLEFESTCSRALIIIQI